MHWIGQKNGKKKKARLILNIKDFNKGELVGLTRKNNSSCHKEDFGDISFWIVRLPCASQYHDPKIINWCNQSFGDASCFNTWSMGVCCTYIYQEYWFNKEEDAVQTWFTWHDYV